MADESFLITEILKLNTAVAGISGKLDGFFQSQTSIQNELNGLKTRVDQGYNKGPTSWGHAHIVQYSNDKRCLLLIHEDGRFMATGDVVFLEDDIVDDLQIAA